MELQRGQRFKLQDAQASGKLEVRCEISGIPASDLRVLLLALDAAEQLVDGKIVDASGGRRTCEGVTSSGGPHGFDIELARLPSRVNRLAIVLAVTESARAKGAQAHSIQTGAVTLKAAGSTVGTYKFHGSDFGRETALCLVEVYKKDGWRVMASGVGFLGGLPSLVSRYGGRLEDLDGSSLPRPSGGDSPPAGGRGGGSPGGLPVGEPVAGPLRVPAHFAGRKEPPVPTGLIPAVGLVLVERSEGAATGTGFMIGPGGYFVTCAHVIRDAQSVSFMPEGTQEMRPAVIVNVDPEGDLALLHTVDRLGSADWLVLSRADMAPSLGDNLGLLGYPLGGDLGINLTYSQGVVNSLRKAENIPILQVDTGAAPGSSGGPVFRRSDGHVVGVLTSGLTQRSGGMLVNFAVDARRLYHLGWIA
ncbi:MAG: trypsin-like peptidase domain-containing protein [Pseudomonadota bacterium]|nr:trypsin-like peptidase domain-containing protein [Pseudomonadota bacterium]